MGSTKLIPGEAGINEVNPKRSWDNEVNPGRSLNKPPLVVFTFISRFIPHKNTYRNETYRSHKLETGYGI